MAVQIIPSKSEKVDLLKNFGFSPTTFKFLDELSLDVLITPSDLTVVEAHTHKVVGKVGLKSGMYTLAKKGVLGSFSKATTDKGIQQVIKQYAPDDVSGLVSMMSSSVMKQASIGDLISKNIKSGVKPSASKPVFKIEAADVTNDMVEEAFKKIAGEFGKATLSGVSDHVEPQVDKEGMMSSIEAAVKYEEAKLTDDRISLGRAKKMYQPVEGTSDGSTYFAIALSNKANMAARIRENGFVSVRVEIATNKHDQYLIEKMPDVKKCLVQAGWGMHDFHASLHFETTNDLALVKKLIGALILELDETMQWKSPLPNVKKIWGKGA